MRKRKKQIPVRSEPVKKRRKQNPKTQTGIPEGADIKKRVKGKPVRVPSGELVNVVADTLERLEFYKGQTDVDARASCEQLGQVIVRSMIYGHTEDGYTKHGEPQVEIREHEYESIPYCKEHK